MTPEQNQNLLTKLLFCTERDNTLLTDGYGDAVFYRNLGDGLWLSVYVMPENHEKFVLNVCPDTEDAIRAEILGSYNGWYIHSCAIKDIPRKNGRVVGEL